ncbi:MAG: PQQ-binding-like beta-propeller repeat protein, partial [Planctomycetes bacterium]|nr:PQQ-binding-like beta-propeller repeat protein [Planctomycetota bacterium]
AGAEAAYASFIAGTFGGVRQIVGYDKVSLGGWDIESGKRLWTLVPPESGDYNVPTPIDVGGKLLVATENNGTRLYRFDGTGAIVPEPIAANEDLVPDTMTPVVLAGRVFGVSGSLACLDLAGGLRTLWLEDDRAFADYASLIGAGDRVLATSVRGELILIDARADRFACISRVKVFGEDSDVYAHPALAGKRLYLRDAESIICIALEE